MANSALGRFRIVAFAEGVSLLALLFIAVPLKHLAHIPGPVRVIGMVHGLLFLLYIVALSQITGDRRWSVMQSIGAIVAAMLPFGTFWLDAKMKREDAALLTDRSAPQG